MIGATEIAKSDADFDEISLIFLYGVSLVYYIQFITLLGYMKFFQ